jgi:hypothetical protein
LLFIDLDLSDFNTEKKLQITLNKTLKSIKEKLENNAHPTVLWSGNGYDGIQPVYCSIELQHIREFQKYKDIVPLLSQEFLRFAKIFYQVERLIKQIIHHLGLVFYVYRILLIQNALPEEKASQTQRLKSYRHRIEIGCQ